MKKRICLLILYMPVLLAPHFVLAKDFIPNGPLVTRTQNPIYLQTLGQNPSKAAVLPKGHVSGWLGAAYSNIFDLGRNGTDEVFLDMELGRLAFNANYGLGRDMEFGLEIPFLHWNGGYFDSWIQEFHKAFGFPNGGRERYPNGAFTYRVTKDGTVIYDVKRMGLGLGDIALGFKHNFLPETKAAPGVAWTFRFKFPTGNSSKGLGSGNIDYSLGCVLEKSISRWHFYLNLDYIVAGGNDKFIELQRGQMLAWLAAVEFSVSRPVSLLAELQGSTPLLDGMGTSRWDGAPMDLVLGVKGRHEKLFLGNDFFWQWSFSEDVASGGPSVDITTMLILGVEFDLF